MIEKKLRKFIFACVIATVGASCYTIADIFFVSKAAGENGLAVMNLIAPIFALIYAIGSMVGIGAATRYSIQKNRNEPCDDYFSNAIFTSLIICLPFMLVGLFCPELVLKLLGADATLVALGATYVRIILCFAPFFMLNTIIVAFVRNDDAPKIAMCATLVSCLFNILFDYILMFPLNLGLMGAALATGCSPIISIGICLIHLLSKKNTIKFTWKTPSPKRFISSCQLGVASFVEQISGGITTLVLNFILLGIAGNTAVAAYGIISNVALVGSSMLNGVSQGLQPMASEATGKADEESKKRIIKHSLLIGSIIALSLLGVILALAEPIVSIFNSEQATELASIATMGMKLYFIGFLFASVNIIRAGYFSAVDKSLQSTIIAISRGFVAIVIFAFLLSKIFGIVGAWLAFPAAELFTLILSLVCEHRLKQKSSPA